MVEQDINQWKNRISTNGRTGYQPMVEQDIIQVQKVHEGVLL